MSQLSGKQIKAVECIMAGLTDTETAQKIGVTRETVNTWKNKDFNFKAELNKQRNDILKSMQDRQREITAKAYNIINKYLDDQLESDHVDVKTALDIIKSFKVQSPTLEEDAEIIQLKETQEKEMKETFLF